MTWLLGLERADELRIVGSRVADSVLLILILADHEVSIVELHLKDRQRADVGCLLRSSERRMVVQIWRSFRHPCHGRWLRRAYLRTVREFAFHCLSVLHALVVIRLTLNDLLTASLERIAEVLSASPEVSICTVAVELVVALDSILLTESLLALMTTMGILGLE